MNTYYTFYAFFEFHIFLNLITVTFYKKFFFLIKNLFKYILLAFQNGNWQFGILQNGLGKPGNRKMGFGNLECYLPIHVYSSK